MTFTFEGQSLTITNHAVERFTQRWKAVFHKLYFYNKSVKRYKSFEPEYEELIRNDRGDLAIQKLLETKAKKLSDGKIQALKERNVLKEEKDIVIKVNPFEFIVTDNHIVTTVLGSPLKHFNRD